jgi:hypothetical protein
MVTKRTVLPTRLLVIGIVMVVALGMAGLASLGSPSGAPRVAGPVGSTPRSSPSGSQLLSPTAEVRIPPRTPTMPPAPPRNAVIPVAPENVPSPAAGLVAVDNSESAKAALNGALDALKSGDLSSARSLARECLGFNPAEIECHHVLGYSFTRGGEYGAELALEIQDCLEVDPADARCLEVQIMAQVRSGDLADAHETMKLRNSLTDEPPDFIGEAAIAQADNEPAAACADYGNACAVGQPYGCAMARACGSAPAGTARP